jgi:hypothetical protein
MVSLETAKLQRSIWKNNRERLLREYSSGFLIIRGSTINHYETMFEAESHHPIIGSKVLGTHPIVIDVVEEQFRKRTRKDNPALPYDIDFS